VQAVKAALHRMSGQKWLQLRSEGLISGLPRVRSAPGEDSKWNIWLAWYCLLAVAGWRLKMQSGTKGGPNVPLFRRWGGYGNSSREQVTKTVTRRIKFLVFVPKSEHHPAAPHSKKYFFWKI
jgi:hypothetical protein